MKMIPLCKYSNNNSLSLPSGAQLYTNDERFGIIHTPGSNVWTLQIKFVQRRDNGLYECQVSVLIYLSNYQVIF